MERVVTPISRIRRLFCIGVADTVEIQAIFGGRPLHAAAMRPNSSAAGCINGEWKAWETVSNWHRDAD